MAKWDKVIDLSLRWDENWTDENIHEMGKWVAKQIKKSIPDYDDFDKYGFQLEELVDSFEDGICTLEEAADINNDNYEFHLQQLSEGKESLHFEIKPVEEFDNYMQELYDFADSERIWVKTKF